MRTIITLFIFGTFFNVVSAQSKLDEPFRSPVDFNMFLSGTFGELRGGHFHSGIDIKTYEQTGKVIKMIADGYISRIKITRFGYGKAIYVAHPNGYTSVYGHLDGFNRTITKYVEEIQRKQKSYELDIPVPKDRLFYKKGNIIAYSGNSGYSFGPHIHFEIRETAGQKPVNPLFFGFRLKDKIPPYIRGFKAYDERGSKEFALTRIKKGKYSLSEQDTIAVSDNVSFGIDAIDMLNGAPNRNGAYSYQLFRNDSLVFHWKADRFSFYETRYIYALTDYAEYVESGRKFLWSRYLPNNKLSMYEKIVSGGVFAVLPEQVDQWTWKVRDLKGNESELHFTTKGIETDSIIKKPETDYSLSPFEEKTIRKPSLTIKFRKNSFYDSVFFDVSRINIDSVKMGYLIGDKSIPVHRRFSIIADSIPFADSLHKKALWMLFDDEDSVFNAVDSKYIQGKVRAEPREFGMYGMKLDTIPPEIQWPNLADTLKSSQIISLTIKDKLSGIKDYNLYLDENWVIAEYDAKNDVLNYSLPDTINRGKHRLKCVLIDAMGNELVSSIAFIVYKD